MVAYILETGVDVSLTDTQGRTVEGFAVETQFTEAIKALEGWKSMATRSLSLHPLFPYLAFRIGPN